MNTTIYKIGSIVVTLYCLFSCSTATVRSSPKQIYFSANDTIVILGLARKNVFTEMGSSEMDRAFSKCRVSKLIESHELNDLLFRKAAMLELSLTKSGTLEELRKLRITGYIVDATVISDDDSNSLVNFTSKELSTRTIQQSTSNPWIKFRFRIFHINSKAMVLHADIMVKSTTIIIGENVDEDIGINKGVNTKFPTNEFRKALKKLTKICHCK